MWSLQRKLVVLANVGVARTEIVIVFFVVALKVFVHFFLICSRGKLTSISSLTDAHRPWTSNNNNKKQRQIHRPSKRARKCIVIQCRCPWHRRVRAHGPTTTHVPTMPSSCTCAPRRRETSKIANISLKGTESVCSWATTWRRSGVNDSRIVSDRTIPRVSLSIHGDEPNSVLMFFQLSQIGKLPLSPNVKFYGLKQNFVTELGKGMT